MQFDATWQPGENQLGLRRTERCRHQAPIQQDDSPFQTAKTRHLTATKTSRGSLDLDSRAYQGSFSMRALRLDLRAFERTTYQHGIVDSNKISRGWPQRCFRRRRRSKLRQ